MSFSVKQGLDCLPRQKTSSETEKETHYYLEIITFYSQYIQWTGLTVVSNFIDISIVNLIKTGLTPFRPMEFSIKLHTIKSGWSIVCIDVSQVITSKKKSFSLRINFVLANSAGPDEMLHHATFHLCLHCLLKFLV